MKKWYKLCPYCANEIKEAAIKCQYCKEKLLEREKKEENVKIVKTNNKCWYCWINYADPDYYHKIKIVRNQFNFNVIVVKARLDKYSYMNVPCCRECNERLSEKKRNAKLKIFWIASLLAIIFGLIVYSNSNSTDGDDWIWILWFLILFNRIAYIVYEISYKKIIEFNKVSESDEWKSLEKEWWMVD